MHIECEPVTALFYVAFKGAARNESEERNTRNLTITKFQLHIFLLMIFDDT